MSDKKFTNISDDENVSGKDLTQNKAKNKSNDTGYVEPLPESSRPRKDGPGGE